MTKEHKKLYKAGKNWVVATLTATTLTLLGGIGTYTAHADTTTENNQSTETANISQANQNNNSGNSIVLNQPVTTQSNSTVKNSQPVQNTPTTETAFAATNSSDGLDPSIYGTVNVKDWDYQNDSNTFNLTSYHGQDTRHIIVPNLNDFDNAGVKIGNATGVGISSKLAKSLAHQSLAFAISKTSGKYSDKVTATDNDWSSVFSNTGLINADVSNLDTRNITNMDSLFASNTELKTVGDLSHWNVSNVTDMSGMFENCNGVIGDLSHWDTSNVRNMSNMFDNYNGVIGDLSHWNVSNVTDMSGMFDNYNGVIGDLSHWDTSNVTDMSWMFYFSSASVSGLNTWNTRQTTNMSVMLDASSLPYKIVAANKSSIVPNQVTLKDNTGKVLAIIDTPTIYDSNKSVRSTIDGIVQAEIDKLNKLNHTSYETPKIISDGDDDYSIANATYVVNNESKTGLINYVDQDGKVVKTDQVSGKVGDKVDVKLSLPDGYELANKDEQIPSSITVGEDGINTITIQVKKLPVVQTGSINYVDQDGKVIKTDTISGKVGDKINVNLSLPDGYELANKDEQIPSSVTVGEDGIKTITIQVKKLPAVQTGSINYVDQNGKTVKIDKLTGKVGDTIKVTLSLPDGYELANKDEQIPSSITVGEDGINTITIQVKKLPVVQTGSINYVDQDGKVIKTDTISGKVGDKINVNLSLPDGYELANKDEQIPSSVTVGEDGIKTITIQVKKLPAVQTGSINYVDQNGKTVKIDKLTGKVGDTIKVTLSLPDGYELANKDEQIPSSITVGEDGINTITIQVKKLPVVQTGSINYVDQDGKVIKTDTISGKVGDKINVNLSLPDGYELANKDEQIPSSVTVGEDGIKTITIQVKKLPAVQTGSINYVDQNGKTVKIDKLTGKVGDTIKVTLSLPDGYELANKDEQVPSVVTVTENGIGTINVNVKKINTTLANNEVPYDSTTVSNNVNANYGNLDGYKLTENDQGQAQLVASGWHATGASNSDRYRYMIVFDNTLGREIARQKLVPQVRSDVQRAYPNVDNSLYSGFNITIDIPNSSINHSLSLISRYSSDPNNGEGARVDHWFNSLAFNEGNQANLDGMSSNGNTLTVNGWHATNQAAGRPYHYIIAWDQNLGHEIARQRVTAVSRPDVANAYSTVANAVNSGFNVSFNLTPQFFNDNIQFISRWTDDAAGNGNAVDYWFKPMNRTNRANLDSVTLSNGQVKVAGWHATDLSQLEPNHYLIVFDNTTGQQVASEKVDLQSSQDVKNVFGDIQTANHSRFNYTFDSLHLIPGHNYSLVSRYSADATGNGNNGAHTDSWLNMGTFQQSAYSIDNVVQNNRHLTVQGWLANDYAMTKPYAYAILIQNGQEIGRQRLTLSERDDVAKVYPQIYRSQYSGFNANFDLPTFSTRGLQLVLRFTDDPAGNGNSSDKWINL